MNLVYSVRQAASIYNPRDPWELPLTEFAQLRLAGLLFSPTTMKIWIPDPLFTAIGLQFGYGRPVETDIDFDGTSLRVNGLSQDGRSIDFATLTGQYNPKVMATMLDQVQTHKYFSDRSSQDLDVFCIRPIRTEGTQAHTNGPELSDWMAVPGAEYCSMRILAGTNPDDVRNRVAFIEKTPRVRLHSCDENRLSRDSRNWLIGYVGDGGHDPRSQAWCDAALLSMGTFNVPNPRPHPYINTFNPCRQ